ncbi:MAG TPA: zf-HC2 domain-containing protein [Longimicrobiales bacterium]|nr:zf-HC2 domain-containing protein [Longimicrobiales bacterium]
MHGPWIERISDSIDGALDASGEQALSAHLEECGECRRVARELRSVVAAAREAPVLEPARDLWPAIASQLGTGGATGAPLASSDIARMSAVTPLRDRGVRSRLARRFSFSAPQLAAAAVLLMSLSGAAVWLIGNGPQAQPVATGTIIQSASEEPRSTQLTALPAPAPEYEADVADLERALEENRARLDPATVDVIERSLESIDRAIEDARTALAADPGNPYLHRQLDNTMQKKIAVLRRAAGVQRVRS